MTSRESPMSGSQDEGAFFRAVLDGLDQFVVVFDSTGEACWWNTTVQSLTGYSRDAEVTPSFDEMVAPPDRERARSAIDRLVETGTLAAELRVEGADGAQCPYEFRGSGFEAPGNESAFVAIGYEIAERREREQKLDSLRERTLDLMATETKAETARLAVDAAQTVIEAPLSGIHFPDSSGELLSPVAAADTVNDAFGEAPTYPRNAPPGSRAATVWSVYESGEPLRIDDVAAHNEITEGTPTGSVILHPLGDHGVFIVSAPSANAFDDTDSALVDILAGALRAALDRVEREGELRRQNERLDRFSQIISHDMRNPLNTAKGFMELAQETGDETHLDQAAQSLDRMEELIDDLLTLAREGDGSLDRERMELSELADRSWQSVETGAATLQIETSTAVWGDESRLCQLFENLFRNSVVHGATSNPPESGEVTKGSTGPGQETVATGLTITVGDLDDGFYVADDGVGIPADERDRVLLSGYSTGEGGTGLGLSIVEEVATAHGWDVTVTESEAGGARFEFHGVDAV